MSPAAEIALAEVRRVAVALAGLGGSATAAQVAARCGMPSQKVVRRLAGAGLSAPGKVARYFACDRPGVQHKGIPGVWSLTDAGRDLVKGSGE